MPLLVRECESQGYSQVFTGFVLSLEGINGYFFRYDRCITIEGPDETRYHVRIEITFQIKFYSADSSVGSSASGEI